MGISDRNVNFRAREETLREISDIQKLLHPFLPDRSTALRWIIRKFWELLFTDTTLVDAVREWQVFCGNSGQSCVTQFSFQFPKEDGYHFLPKIRGIAQ